MKVAVLGTGIMGAPMARHFAQAGHAVRAWNRTRAKAEPLAEHGEGLGVDPATFLDIIDGGPMGPPYAKMKGTMMVERAYPTSFALAMAGKDARLVAEAAEAAGLDLPIPRVVAERMQAAVEAGHGDEDMAATVEAGRR